MEWVLLILIISLFLLIYSLFGYMAWDGYVRDELYYLTKNPLWTPFAAILWPIALIILGVLDGYYHIKKWVEKVIRYYKNKRR